MVPDLDVHTDLIVDADKGEANFAAPHSSRLDNTDAALFELSDRRREAPAFFANRKMVRAFALLSQKILEDAGTTTGSTTSQIMFEELA